MFPAEWIYKDNYEFTMPQLRELLGIQKTRGADLAGQLRARGIHVAKGRLHGVTQKDALIRIPIDHAETIYLELQYNPLDTEQKLQCSKPKEPSQLDRIEALLVALCAQR